MIRPQNWFFKMNQRQKKQYDIIVNKAKERNFQVLSDYVSIKEYMLFLCPNKHEVSMRPDLFKNGTNCRFCPNKASIKAKNDFIKLAEKENFTVMGEYIGTHNKIKMLCPVKHEIEITPNHFKSGDRCKVCSRRCPIQAEEELYEIAEERDFKVAGQYINNHTKISMICPNNHTISINPSSFKAGYGCSQCTNQCPIKAKNELIELANIRKYKILGEYINTNTKIEMQCPEKNHPPINIKPANFKLGQGCARCSGNCPIQAEEELYEIAERRNYEILSEYKGAHDKISVKCPNNDHPSFEITASSFKNGNGCARCAKNSPLQSLEDLYKIAEERDCRIIGKYINCLTKILMECPEGHTFEITPSGFKNGHGCNQCNMSGLESRIALILDKYKIKYLFDTYKIDNQLRYDFYLIDYNYILEIDGSQHFEINHFYNNDFIERRYRDMVKYRQCRNKNIQMIRLDYKWIPKNTNSEIYNFIMEALESPATLTVSTPKIYTWIETRLPDKIYEQYNVKKPKKIILKLKL